MSELLLLWMWFATAAKSSLEANLAPMAIGGANTVLLWQISRSRKREEEKQFDIDLWHQIGVRLKARDKQIKDAFAFVKDMTSEQRQQRRLQHIWRERKKKRKEGIVDELEQFRTNPFIKRRKKDT